MFQNNGMPTGYDQIAPGRDTPRASTGTPAAPPQPLQQAIVGPSQYPADPSMQQWRNGSSPRPAGGVNFGGGWDTNTDPVASALQKGLQSGQSGQSLVDSINQQFNLPSGHSLAYYSDKGQYAMPHWYAAPNAQTGQLDLVTRGGGAPNSALMAALLHRQQQTPQQPADPYGSLLSFMNQATQQQ